MEKWTFVKDALPEKPGRYLVIGRRYPNYPFIANFATSLSEVDAHAFTTIRPGFWGTDDAAIFAYHTILAWMPLPKVPEVPTHDPE